MPWITSLPPYARRSSRTSIRLTNAALTRSPAFPRAQQTRSAIAAALTSSTEPSSTTAVAYGSDSFTFGTCVASV